MSRDGTRKLEFSSSMSYLPRSTKQILAQTKFFTISYFLSVNAYTVPIPHIVYEHLSGLKYLTDGVKLSLREDLVK